MISTILQSDEALVLEGRRVHFSGIGGCGMSGLARLVRARGARVSGSDQTASSVTDALIAEGISVVIEQSDESMPGDTDLLVCSAAIKADHPERRAAAARGIAVLKYAQVLGRLMIGRTGVAIAGTHGKSTTTAMLAHALIVSGCDPSFIVGAHCRQIGGGVRVGRADLLVAEACEFDRSFHNFRPTHSVVLNVEEDHLDVYGSLDAIVQAFNHFARLTAESGSLLISHESAYRTAVAAGVGCAVETIGFAPQAHWRITTVAAGGRQHVTLREQERICCEFELSIPGEHMAYNASVASVTAHRLGAGWSSIAQAMGSFEGLDRRMQYLGEVGGVKVIDDYGHHPTEIDTTLGALRRHYLSGERAGRLICVFQPHQHSRTRFLLEQFATSFAAADVVIVPHIYFVRDSEADRRAVSASDLVARLHGRGVIAEHIDAFEDIVSHLAQITRAGDLLVVMGAGPVWQVARDFVNQRAHAGR